VPDCPLHLICCQLYAFTPRLIRAGACFRHGRLCIIALSLIISSFFDTTLATSNAQSPANATTPSSSSRALLCMSIAIACGEVRTATDGVASLQANMEMSRSAISVVAPDGRSSLSTSLSVVRARQEPDLSKASLIRF